jgi:uncharacterized protein (DUF362 family)
MGIDEKVDVAIVRSGSVGASVARAIELSGGLDFIQPGQTVVIKPNVNSGDAYPGTTNPEVVQEVVRLVWERDPARVIVADRSWFLGGTLDLMQETGIYEAAINSRAEVLPLEDVPWELVHPQEAKHWPQPFRVTTLLKQADHVINLPVVKTHSLAAFTMSIKNAVGLIHTDDRLATLHKITLRPDGKTERGPDSNKDPGFSRRLAEINLVCPTSLVVMDGTRAFVAGGPSKGDMVEPGVIIASRDRIANDAVGLALLKTLGTEDRIQNHSVWEQTQIKRSIELGVGVAGPDQIALQADGIPELDQIQANVA